MKLQYSFGVYFHSMANRKKHRRYANGSAELRGTEKVGLHRLYPGEGAGKSMQFGEGNFLRAFVDDFIDIANEKAGFNGKAALKEIVTGISYRNAKQYFGFEQKKI